MTVITQNDRYLNQNDPYTEQKVTVILVEKIVENGCYIYKRNSRSFWGYSDVGVIVMLVTKQGR